MASEKQILANRENGKKGGAGIASGKLAVRHNAVTLRLFSQDMLPAGEDGSLLEAMQENITAELQV